MVSDNILVTKLSPKKAASEGASAGMTVSEHLALEKVKRGEMFEGAKNGKYADEYLAMLR